MHECFPKHSSMGTPGIKEDKETDEEGKKRDMSMERITAGAKGKGSPDGLNYSNQYKIINIIC